MMLSLFETSARLLPLLALLQAQREWPGSERTVEPHRLVCVARRWYLLAWDRTREEWRTFRLDRVVQQRRAGGRLVRRPLPRQAQALVADACLLDLGSHSVERRAAHLCTLGVDFEVQEPPELIAAVRALGQRCARAVRGR